MAKPLLQSSVSHDPSKIISMDRFGAKKTFLLISQVKTVLLLVILNIDTILSGFFDEKNNLF